MKTLQIITLVTFAVEATGIGAGLLTSERLFRVLEKNYPRYYKQIGQPTALRFIAFPTSSDISRRLRSNALTLSLVFKGIPAGFPKDRKLQKLASAIRYLFAGLFVVFIPLFILFFISFR